MYFANALRSLISLYTMKAGIITQRAIMTQYRIESQFNLIYLLSSPRI